jgi:hypothetical protein
MEIISVTGQGAGQDWRGWSASDWMDGGERAAILQFRGGISRPEAEAAALRGRHCPLAGARSVPESAAHQIPGLRRNERSDRKAITISVGDLCGADNKRWSIRDGPFLIRQSHRSLRQYLAGFTTGVPTLNVAVSRVQTPTNSPESSLAKYDSRVADGGGSFDSVHCIQATRRAILPNGRSGSSGNASKSGGGSPIPAIAECRDNRNAAPGPTASSSSLKPAAGLKSVG